MGTRIESSGPCLVSKRRRRQDHLLKVSGEVVGFGKEAMVWEDPRKQVEEEKEEAAMVPGRPIEVRDLEIRGQICGIMESSPAAYSCP